MLGKEIQHPMKIRMRRVNGMVLNAIDNSLRYIGHNKSEHLSRPRCVPQGMAATRESH